MIKFVKDLYSKTNGDRLKTIKKFRDTFNCKLTEAKKVVEEAIGGPHEIHEIVLYSTKPVGVVYNNDNGKATVVMASTIEEAVKVMLD